MICAGTRYIQRASLFLKMWKSQRLRRARSGNGIVKGREDTISILRYQHSVSGEPEIENGTVSMRIENRRWRLSLRKETLRPEKGDRERRDGVLTLIDPMKTWEKHQHQFIRCGILTNSKTETFTQNDSFRSGDKYDA